MIALWTTVRSACRILGCALLFASVTDMFPQSRSDDLAARARSLHFSSIVIDSHSDTTQRLLHEDFNLSQRHADGDMDVPRMRDGGVGAALLSIWIPATTLGPAAVHRALDQIDLVQKQVADNPEQSAIAFSAADVQRAHATGKIAILLGLEGGHMIGNDPAMVRIFRQLDVRYMTLAHVLNNEWADSSTDRPVHGGLTPFGKGIVREMNRQGMLVDVSHVSDRTFYDALEVSEAPLIALHSSCRAISDHARNMSDEMIKALAAKGGMILINYNLIYRSQEYKDAINTAMGDNSRLDETFHKQCGDDAFCQQMAQDRLVDHLTRQGKLPHVGWEKIVDHIDHVAKLVVPEHVGLESDFDGATIPEGMEDVLASGSCRWRSGSRRLNARVPKSIGRGSSYCSSSRLS